MFSIKSKSKRHCRRRRSTRHRRRMHNRKGGGKLEDLHAQLKALDAKAVKEPATFGGTFAYGMARKDLLEKIAMYDTPEVKASKAQTLAAKTATASQESDKWLAAVAKSDAAQGLKEQAYLDRFVHTPLGSRLKRPGETPGAQYPK